MKNNSNNQVFKQKRDYDKNPLIIKDYSYFFGVSLRFFSIFVAVTIIFYIYCIINPMKEEIEIWILFLPVVVPLALVLYDYYVYVVRDNYTLYFANNSIDYMLGGKLKRKIYINEIPNYLLKPFWKDKLDIRAIVFF
ncbi:hypothetical protein [Campylobacter corcagiensis]|uniref:hypothetical protein n=1 Tax=Campylobacter corcagiensis TaxID=1448857 RepID=UPI0004B670F6|nr:hypothetical protein [Campylobacter corcagiensis]